MEPNEPSTTNRAAEPQPCPPFGKVRVLVVDDHPIMREGLLRVIDTTPDLMVCAHAENIPQAQAAVESSNPAVVIVDIGLGNQNGLELIKDLKARRPALPVLVHSMHEESLYAERCLRAGALGYVMKHEPPQRLLDGVRHVLKGDVFLSEAMTRQLLCTFSRGPAHRGSSPADRLSDREFEVFELLGQGHRTSEIAQRLHLSDKTIQTYREHIKEKLGLEDAVALVRRAVQWVEARK